MPIAKYIQEGPAVGRVSPSAPSSIPTSSRRAQRPRLTCNIRLSKIDSSNSFGTTVTDRLPNPFCTFGGGARLLTSRDKAPARQAHRFAGTPGPSA